LDLIGAYDPQRLHEIERDVRRFGIEKVGGDRYDHGFRAHVLSKHWLSEINNTVVALNVVHEATHARIAARGVPYNQATAARIEALCVGQEIAFARRLPGDQQWIVAIEQKLEKPWWNATNQRAKREERLRAVGVPGWLIPLLLGRAGRNVSGQGK